MITTLILASAAPKDLFDRAIQLIRRADRGSFSVKFDSRQNEIRKSGAYEVAYVRPDALRIRSLIDRTDRTFTLVGKDVFGVDSKAHEYLVAKAGTKGSVSDRMGLVVPVDEPIRILVDPGVGQTFLGAFKGMDGWRQVRATPPLLELKESTGAFAIGFDGTGRLASVRVEGPAGVLAWSYRYGGAPKAIRFVKPSGFKKVDQFYDVPPERAPKYQDAAARTAVEACLRAYSRLRDASIVIDDGSAQTEMWLSAGKVRQRSAAGDWAWDGKTLSVVQKTDRTFRQGPAKLRAVDLAVGKCGMPMDPLLRKLVRKENPITAMLDGDLTGHTVGQIGSGALRCDVIEFRSSGIRMTLTIRRDNGLLLASASENLDRRGKVVSRSERRFDYRSIGKPIAASTFVLAAPSGYRSAPLP